MKAQAIAEATADKSYYVDFYGEVVGGFSWADHQAAYADADLAFAGTVGDADIAWTGRVAAAGKAKKLALAPDQQAYKLALAAAQKTISEQLAYADEAAANAQAPIQTAYWAAETAAAGARHIAETQAIVMYRTGDYAGQADAWTSVAQTIGTPWGYFQQNLATFTEAWWQGAAVRQIDLAEAEAEADITYEATVDYFYEQWVEETAEAQRIFDLAVADLAYTRASGEAGDEYAYILNEAGLEENYQNALAAQRKKLGIQFAQLENDLPIAPSTEPSNHLDPGQAFVLNNQDQIARDVLALDYQRQEVVVAGVQAISTARNTIGHVNQEEADRLAFVNAVSAADLAYTQAEATANAARMQTLATNEAASDLADIESFALMLASLVQMYPSPWATEAAAEAQAEFAKAQVTLPAVRDNFITEANSERDLAVADAEAQQTLAAENFAASSAQRVSQAQQIQPQLATRTTGANTTPLDSFLLAANATAPIQPAVQGENGTPPPATPVAQPPVVQKPHSNKPIIVKREDGHYDMYYQSGTGADGRPIYSRFEPGQDHEPSPLLRAALGGEALAKLMEEDASKAQIALDRWAAQQTEETVEFGEAQAAAMMIVIVVVVDEGVSHDATDVQLQERARKDIVKGQGPLSLAEEKAVQERLNELKRARQQSRDEREKMREYLKKEYGVWAPAAIKAWENRDKPHHGLTFRNPFVDGDEAEYAMLPDGYQMIVDGKYTKFAHDIFNSLEKEQSEISQRLQEAAVRQGAETIAMFDALIGARPPQAFLNAYAGALGVSTFVDQTLLIPLDGGGRIVGAFVVGTSSAALIPTPLAPVGAAGVAWSGDQYVTGVTIILSWQHHASGGGRYLRANISNPTLASAAIVVYDTAPPLIVGTVPATPSSAPTVRLYAYSPRPFAGSRLDGIAGGRPFVSSVPPGPWQTSTKLYDRLLRIARLGRWSPRPYVYELNAAEAANFRPLPLITPANILWKRWAGQYATLQPGSMAFGSGQILPATSQQVLMYYTSLYGDTVIIGGGTPVVIIVVDRYVYGNR